MLCFMVGRFFFLSFFLSVSQFKRNRKKKDAISVDTTSRASYLPRHTHEGKSSSCGRGVRKIALVPDSGTNSPLKLLPEQGNRSGHSDKVSYRLCQENGESLVRKKQRQYVNKRDQQDDFAQAGQKKRRLGIADGDKSLLTGNLHPHKEKHCRVNSESA